jgi:tetratricopeptide (TPR) repeat protein
VIPVEAEDRYTNSVREIVVLVRSALANPEQADRAFLTKVAARLRDIPPTIATDGQLEALQAICRFFLSRDQDLPFAMEAAATLTRMARATGRKQELLNGLVMQAVVASQLDNHIEALESCASAREVAIEIGSPLGEMKAVINAAAFLLNVGHYQYAIDLLRVGLTIADRCPEADNILWIVLGNIAQCYLFLGEYEEALQAIGAARAMATEPTDAHGAGNRAILEYTHLRTLVALKRGTESRHVLEAMGAFAAKAGTVRARIGLRLCPRHARGRRGPTGPRPVAHRHCARIGEAGHRYASGRAYRHGGGTGGRRRQGRGSEGPRRTKAIAVSPPGDKPPARRADAGAIGWCRRTDRTQHRVRPPARCCARASAAPPDLIDCRVSLQKAC